MSLIAQSTKRILFHSGVFHLPRLLAWRDPGPVVLRFHSVGSDADYCHPTNAVSPDLFDRQMRLLARAYRVVSLDRIVDAMLDGLPLPPRTVAITFDDGYADNHDAALPILLRHGLTATFYVTSGPVLDGRAFWVGWLNRACTRCKDPARISSALALAGVVPARALEADADRVFRLLAGAVNRLAGRPRRDLLREIGTALAAPPLDARSEFMMTPDQVRALARAGMTVGAHTVDHPILSSLPEEEAMRELQESRLGLEALLDRPVRHMAYPNGPGIPANFDDTTRALAARAGYRSASTSLGGVAGPGGDPFALRRQGITQSQGMAGFALKLEQGRIRATLGMAEA